MSHSVNMVNVEMTNHVSGAHDKAVMVYLKYFASISLGILSKTKNFFHHQGFKTIYSLKAIRATSLHRQCHIQSDHLHKNTHW